MLNLFKAVVSQETGAGGSGIAILVEDHSERYSLEEKLAHNERLASIGQLASGVAHEIGNPVTGIACLAQDLRAELADAPQAGEGLEQILVQTERISRIVRSLSNFSHAGTPDEYPVESLEVAQIVGEAVNLVSLSQAGKQMQYENGCERDLMISGYAHKLVQVFVNLLTNATDASEPGQKVRVAAERRGDYVSISVSDHGKGIPENHLPRVFEPFFTTKTVGEGTGLGLSLTYNIVQEHGGSITVSSNAGRGCRFEILLPGADESLAVQV